MQTIPLYHTTGISGFKITRIRTVANSGKTKTLEGQEESGTPLVIGYARPLIEPYVQFSRIRLSVWD